jgi:hypothetical protein
MDDHVSLSRHDRHQAQERRQEQIAAWWQSQITRGEEMQRQQSQQLRASETATDTQTQTR